MQLSVEEIHHLSEEMEGGWKKSLARIYKKGYPDALHKAITP